MARSVALISLHPLDQIGGGERYTFCTWRSIRLAGDDCRLFSRSGGGPSSLPFNERLGTLFTEFGPEGEAIGNLSLRDLLLTLAGFDVVWIHQFLSSDAVFDIIAAVATDQTLLFTNLGHEAVLPQFQAFYCRASNHFFVEISDYAAMRSQGFRGQSRGVIGSIWREQVAPMAAVPEEPEHQESCAVGRVLPHKGLEIAISALPEMWQLNIIGPFDDDSYLRHLRSVARHKNVRFLGPLPEESKQSVLRRARCLIASSCHETYDGRRVPQAELLGLVVFEAIGSGVLPVTSDIPSFHEVMTKLGLARFIYKARDAGDLNRVLRSIGCLPAGSRRTLVRNAAETIAHNYSWDDYWTRVVTAIASPD